MGEPIRLYPEPSDTMSQFWIDKFEKDAAKNWDVFYRRNKANFFKDRHYLDREFPELAPEETGGAGKVFAEVGCGAGNTVMPLAEMHANATFYACDFSARAVELVKSRAQETGLGDRVHAFVCDATREALVPSIPAGTVNALTLVFVLSAIAPDTMAAAVRHCAATLAPGGRILVRDYAAGDLAEERFDKKSGCQKLGDNFYVRSDGTRAFYFSEERLRSLFEAEGLRCVHLVVHERDVQNRARGLKMDRRWIQGTFELGSGGGVGSGAGGGGGEAAPARGAGNGAAGAEAGNSSEAAVEESRAGSAGGGAGAAGEDAGPDRATEADGVRSLGGDLTWCFLEPEAAKDDVSVSLGGAATVKVKVIGREHQHTERATGLMLWEGASALASHVAQSPDLFVGRSVLELGAGSSGLPSMAAALVSARIVIATDGHPDVIAALKENLALNGFLDTTDAGPGQSPAPSSPGMGAAVPVHTCRLRWGESADMVAVRALAGPGGFEVIVGADLVYERSALPLLFSTAAALLAEGGVLLLCHVSNRGGVNEDEVIERAVAAGFEAGRSGGRDLYEGAGPDGESNLETGRASDAASQGPTCRSRDCKVVTECVDADIGETVGADSGGRSGQELGPAAFSCCRLLSFRQRAL